MDNVNLLEAWRLWFDGQQIIDIKLGWWSILWWGRIGKILGGFGIIGLILEIIGATMLQQFGARMRRPFWQHYPLNPARAMWDWSQRISSIEVNANKLEGYFRLVPAW